MFKNFLNLKTIFLLSPLILGGLVFITLSGKAATQGTVSATVKINVCGNAVAEPPVEQCDNTDFAGLICDDYGFNAGYLACNPDCTIDTVDCFTEQTGGGSTGGGVSGPPPPPQESTGVNFSGRAYPLNTVTLLKDAQIVATTIAGPNSLFEVSLTNLSAGSYNFSIYGEDDAGNRSSLFTFSIYVSRGATTNISGIFIAPTISVDKSQVKQGDNIAIFGQSSPNSDVIIGVSSDLEQYVTTPADEDGVYLHNFNTASLEKGNHLTKSRSSYIGEISPYSRSVGFVVGDKNVVSDDSTCGAGTGDLNCDTSVDLIDFSIMAYWYERLDVPMEVDLNHDGKINLIDFSILAYYWTG